MKKEGNKYCLSHPFTNNTAISSSTTAEGRATSSNRNRNNGCFFFFLVVVLVVVLVFRCFNGKTMVPLDLNIGFNKEPPAPRFSCVPLGVVCVE